jgi:hypothetical protein
MEQPLEVPLQTNTTYHDTGPCIDTMMVRRSSNNHGNDSTANDKNSNAMTMTDQIEDLLARIVHRVDLHESHEGDGSTAERGSDNSANKSIDSNGKIATNRSGPLLPREISELSFLCNAIAAATISTTPGTTQSVNNKKRIGFASVDVDSVLSLIELLDRHVNLAVAMNVIESSVGVLSDTTKSPSQIAAALEQVRNSHAMNTLTDHQKDSHPCRKNINSG